MDATIKGLEPSTVQFDGSPLRIAIVHARWNKTVIDALVAGTVQSLKAQGVKESNIVIQTVPGSFELPFACAKVLAGGQVQPGFDSSTSLTPDLLGDTTSTFSSVTAPQPFDAIIAIGTLIKGSTMHFEYICDSVSHALMKLQMDTGVPVIFGVLTCLTDDQALERAGLGRGVNKGHNHGEDWGRAAVEMASNVKQWAAGKFA